MGMSIPNETRIRQNYRMNKNGNKLAKVMSDQLSIQDQAPVSIQ
jgi:hypothetical protein